MSIKNEVKVGFIGLVVLFGSIFLFNYLKQRNLFSRNLIITARFLDLEFIKKGDPVLIKGRKYGRVSDVYQKNGELLVDMDIDPNAKVPPTAKAVIAELSMLGGRTVSITYSGTCSSNCLKTGAVIPGEIGNLKTQVANFAVPILEKIGGFADTLIAPEGLKRILGQAQASMHNLANSTQNFENKMQGMVKTLPTSVKNFKDLTTMLVETDKNQDDATAKQILALAGQVKKLSSMSQSDIEKMTKVLYTAKDQLKGLPNQVEKGKKAIDKANKTIDSLNLKLAGFNEGASGTVPKLLYDGAYKDTLQAKIKTANQKIQNIREHPEENLTLKKKKK